MVLRERTLFAARSSHRSRRPATFSSWPRPHPENLARRFRPCCPGRALVRPGTTLLHFQEQKQSESFLAQTTQMA